MKVSYTYILFVLYYFWLHAPFNFVSAVVLSSGVADEFVSKESSDNNAEGVEEDDDEGDQYISPKTLRSSSVEKDTHTKKPVNTNIHQTASESSCAPAKCSCPGVFVLDTSLVLGFDKFRTETTEDYIMALLVLGGLALLSPLIKAMREPFRLYMIKRRGCLAFAGGSCTVFLVTTICHCIDWFLMLIVMSFNVGAFFTVCGSYALGYTLTSFVFVKPTGSDVTGSEALMECH